MANSFYSCYAYSHRWNCFKYVAKKRLCILIVFSSEGANDGWIKWKFSSEKTSLVIGRIKLRYQCTLYETGSVNMTICNNDTCIRLDSSEYSYVDRTDTLDRNRLSFSIKTRLFYIAEKTECDIDSFRGSCEITLSTMMNGGNGSTAWQHAQLFRQPIEDTNCLFELDISLVPNGQPLDD